MAIHRLQHEKILAAAHIKQPDPSVLHTLETGPETSAYVCASCQAPWLRPKEEGTCLGCKSKTRRVSKSEGLGMPQEVDGVRWTLSLTDKGISWTAPQDLTKEQEEEEEAINAEFGASLPQPATPMETSFSDWVPSHPPCSGGGRRE